MTRCVRCGSHAINPNKHGREEGKDLNLCDVCYWWKRAEYFLECAKVREKRLCKERLASIHSMQAELCLIKGDNEGYQAAVRGKFVALFGESMVDRIMDGKESPEELLKGITTYQETHPLEEPCQ